MKIPAAMEAQQDHSNKPYTNQASKEAKKYRKPFLAFPVVGFFDQRQRKGKTSPSRTVGKGETKYLLVPNSNSVRFNYEASNNNNNTTNTNKNSVMDRNDHVPAHQQRKRTGQELWSILRYHVRHESFHIRNAFRDTYRCRVDDIQFSKDVDLPYDFTVIDCFLALCVYLGISIAAYSFVFERWTIIDSMYFAVVTFTTIGYGDLTPTTHGGRMFASLFALSGVAVLAIGLGVVGSKIIETQVSQISKAEDRIIQDMFSIFQPRTAKEKQADYGKRKSSISDVQSESFDYLNDFDNPSFSIHEECTTAIHPWYSCAESCRYFIKFLATYLPSLCPLFLGAYFIGHYEGWSWDDCIYYCVVTTTTIGYGDYTPQHQTLRLFAVLFIPLSVGAMGHFLGTIATFIVEQRSRVYDRKLWRHELTLDDLHAMSAGHQGLVTELDFVIFMLKAMKKVDTDLIDKIREHFHRLDLTGSGTLVRDDLELMAKCKLRGARSKLRLSAYKKKLSHQGSLSFHSTDDDESDAIGETFDV